MRFLMFMIPNNARHEGGALPSPELVEAMTRYNEELVKAGALLDGEGLHPTSQGVRVSFSGGKPTVKDGPFTEAKEIIGGYWKIQVKSKAEAVEWARRVPAEEGNIIELRQIFEMEDFPQDVQDAAKSDILPPNR